MAECSTNFPLGRMIYFMAQDIRNLAEKVLSPYDLTLEQFHALKLLEHNPGLSQRQLGQEAQKSAANVTRILDRLAAKSLVLRQPAPEDRRAFLIFLTDRGQTLLREVETVFEAFSAGLHQGISEEMQQTTKAAIDILAHNISVMSTELKHRE